MAVIEETPTYFEFEGRLISTDGEEIGIVLPDGSHALYGTQVANPWIPTTEEDLKYLMSRRLSRVTVIAERKAELVKIQAMAQANIGRAESSLERFEAMFGQAIRSLAKKFLPKGLKTWSSPYGSVSYKSVGAKLKVDTSDGAEAKRMAWAKKHAPESIVQPPAPAPEFHISKLTDEQKKAFLADPKLAAEHGFVVEEPTEDVKVKNEA